MMQNDKNNHSQIHRHKPFLSLPVLYIHLCKISKCKHSLNFCQFKYIMFQILIITILNVLEYVRIIILKHSPVTKYLRCLSFHVVDIA